MWWARRSAESGEGAAAAKVTPRRSDKSAVLVAAISIWMMFERALLFVKKSLDAQRPVIAGPEAWIIHPVPPGMVATAFELERYRRLFWFFAVQSIKGLYEGTSLGMFWLFARPLLPILISTFIFGRLLNVPSDGLPYFLFFLAGTSIWMVFERALLFATKSLDNQRSVIQKLYFPRLIVPMASIAPAVAYIGIYMVLLVCAAVYYVIKDGRWYLAFGPGWIVAFVAVALSMVLAIGVGLFTCVWQVRHKEVRFGLRYVTRFWFYLTPVIYPMSQVPPELQWVIYLNPMSSFVETFKWGLLGVGQFAIVPLLCSVALTAAIGVAGVWYFSRSEAASVDEM